MYLVTGTTGEYSDRSEWTVCLFRTEEAAREYVDFLSRKRQELPSYYGFGCSWSEQQAIEEAMRAFDPEFSEDYTGTRWFVSSAPLCERGQGPASAHGNSGRPPESLSQPEEGR